MCTVSDDVSLNDADCFLSSMRVLRGGSVQGAWAREMISGGTQELTKPSGTCGNGGRMMHAGNFTKACWETSVPPFDMAALRSRVKTKIYEMLRNLEMLREAGR